ncbi:MAG: L-seryl-tRNA selenium transferase, partial [Halobacteriales archaeon]
ILAGRGDLLGSAAMQHLDMHVAEEVWDPPAELIDLDRFGGVPRQGIGRHLKVGKEELVGLIRALELFVEEDTDEREATWRARAESVADALSDAPGYDAELRPAGKTDAAASVRVTIDPDRAGIDAETLVEELRRENPRVFVGPDYIHESVVTVNPMCLTDEDAAFVADRLLAYHD